MGNLMFLTSHKAAISDRKLAATLDAISKDRFRGQLGVSCASAADTVTNTVQCAGWDIKSPGEQLPEPDSWHHSWDLWRVSLRKFECKHARGMWTQWTQSVVFNELSYRLKLTISDEGISDRWVVTQEDLAKTATFRKWFELMHPIMLGNDPAILEAYWEEVYLPDVPADWRNYKEVW